MRSEVIKHDDVARSQGRHKHLVDVGDEDVVIHGAVDHAGGGETVDPKCGNQRAGLPPPIRRAVTDALSADPAGISAEQVGGDTGFIDEDEPRGVERGCLGPPLLASDDEVSALLFGGPYGFF